MTDGAGGRRLHLVRHGRVVDHLLDGHDNPGLSEVGRRQAEAVAAAVQPDYLASSPLRRALETAEPIARRTDLEVEVVPLVREVVPPGLDAPARREFLARLVASVWAEQPESLKDWRASVLEGCRSLARWGEDVVVVTHFVPINVVAGAALGDDRVVVFKPANASVSTFVVDDAGIFSVVDLGRAEHLDDLTR